MDSYGFFWISNHDFVVNSSVVLSVGILSLCITVVGGTLQENPRVGKGRPGKNT